MLGWSGQLLQSPELGSENRECVVGLLWSGLVPVGPCTEACVQMLSLVPHWELCNSLWRLLVSLPDSGCVWLGGKVTLGFFDLFGFCNQEMKWADWSPSWPQCHRHQLEEYLSVTENITHSLGRFLCYWMLHSPTPHPRTGFICCFQDVSDYCHFSAPLVAIISVQTIGNSFMKWNFKNVLTSSHSHRFFYGSLSKVVGFILAFTDCGNKGNLFPKEIIYWQIYKWY